MADDSRLNVQSGPFKDRPQQWFTRSEVERLLGAPAGDWQQYAKEGETAQACIERHRREHDALLKLLAQAREPLTDEQVIALLPAGWAGMLAQVMEFARRIQAAPGVTTSHTWAGEASVPTEGGK